MNDAIQSLSHVENQLSLESDAIKNNQHELETVLSSIQKLNDDLKKAKNEKRDNHHMIEEYAVKLQTCRKKLHKIKDAFEEASQKLSSLVIHIHLLKQLVLIVLRMLKKKSANQILLLH